MAIELEAAERLRGVLEGIEAQLKRAKDWRERPSVRDRCFVLRIDSNDDDVRFCACPEGWFDVNQSGDDTGGFVSGWGQTPSAALADYDRKFKGVE